MNKEELFDKIADNTIGLFLIRLLFCLLFVVGFCVVGGMIYLIASVVTWPFITLANMITG